jgi:serine/threonine protein kinase
MFIIALFLLSGGLIPQASAQQSYGGSWVSDCGNQHNDSGLLGYFCSSGSAPSCPTYLTFNARQPYTDLASIASLLGVDAATLAAANSVGETAALAPGTKVLVPATCSCTATPAGRFYQRNASAYVVRPGDLLISIANDVFQGLTTCQALQAQALHKGQTANNLQPGQALSVPLRCACPSAAQALAGVRFLVSYLVGVSDEVSSVAARFGVAQEAVEAANELKTPPFTVFPNTTLLIPVTAPPNVSQIQSPRPPPPLPPVAATPPAGKRSSNHAEVYIGVGVAAAIVVAVVGAFFALKMKRRRRLAGAVLATTAPNGKGNDKSSSPGRTTGASASLSDAFSSSVSVSEIKSSLKVYTYAELRAATDDFSPDRRIGGWGSVYRAEFGGDFAAVEAVDRDVAAEVEIMRKVNHLNLIRLVGLCHHRGRWYLVTEYAEHGVLREGLARLSWAQRVRVALDVAEGLRYLHEYTDPPCVHMDVSSDTVLLAGAEPRAKLRGFAAARAITSSSGNVVFTMTSRIAGTRGYMAPEYLEHGAVSPKADVYALGVVLLELVTGRDVEDLVGGDDVGDPFAGLRDLAALAEDRDHGGTVTRRLEELVDPAMPAGSCPRDAVLIMVRLIERCVRRDAAGRPTTGEVAQRLLKMSGVSVVSWQRSRDPESPRSPGR